MNGEWLQHRVLRAASLLAPGDQRAEWLMEWHSELWYIPRRGATRFCLGAFRDALWLRRNCRAERTAPFLESPLACLAFLVAVAAAGMLIAFALPVPEHLARFWRWRAQDMPMGCVLTLAYSGVFLPATRLAMGGPSADRPPTAWPFTLRRGLFMAAKIVLVQPIMLCGLLIPLRAGAAPLMPLTVCASVIFGCRWVLADQRRRCPVCLRLLTNPVRIGAPSQTLLAWYGAESVCSRGHGLLQVPEISASYSGGRQWLRLDHSWSSLFPQADGARQ